MKLQLQAMPAPASVLNVKPTLRADNVPVILLQEMPIHCELYDGENMAGPVPTLFGSGGDYQGEHHHGPRGLAEAGKEILLPGVHPSQGGGSPQGGHWSLRFRRPKFQPSSNNSISSPHHKKQKTSYVSGRIKPIPTVSLSKYSTETDHITKFLESLCISNPETTVHSNGFLNAA